MIIVMRSLTFVFLVVLATVPQSSGRMAETAADPPATIGPAESMAPVQTTVPAGADLQTYINRARPGDVLLLEPGATSVGTFTRPPRPAQPPPIPPQYITIRSAADTSPFPTSGRVTPEHAEWMPTIRSPNGGFAVATQPGAPHCAA